VAVLAAFCEHFDTQAHVVTASFGPKGNLLLPNAEPGASINLDVLEEVGYDILLQMTVQVPCSGPAKYVGLRTVHRIWRNYWLPRLA
jgi:hypothetical protein